MCSQYMLDVHQIAEMPKKGQWLLFEECVRTHGLCTFSLFVCECFLFQPALGHCFRRPQLVICIAKTLLIKTNTFKAPIFALGLPYIVLVLSVFGIPRVLPHKQQSTTLPVGCFVENILLSLFSKAHLHMTCPVIYLRLVI